MNEKRIKTLWLPSWHPSRRYPLLGKFSLRHAMAAAAFVEVAVVVLEESRDGKTGIETATLDGQFTEVKVYWKKSPFWLLDLVRCSWARWRGCRFVCKRLFRPDILHLSVIYPAGLAALPFSLLHRLPMVIDEHWTGYHPMNQSFKGFFLPLLARLCAWRSKAMIAESDYTAQNMQRHGLKGKYAVVPNVVDTSFQPGHSKLTGSTSKIQFIHVSSLHDPQKNISGLLRATCALAHRRQDFRLLMVGGDEGTEPFERLVEKLQISSLVKFASAVPHNEALQKMTESNAFVLFSQYEGLPCALLEAMNAGLPVICTETGGMDEWVTPETGILIDIGEEDALAEAMSRMIDTHQNYDPKKISRIIEERCSYEVVGRQFEEIYKQVLSAPR